MSEAGESRQNLAGATMPGRYGGTLKRGNVVGVGRPKKITHEHELLLARELPEAIRLQLKPLGFKGKTWGAAYAFGAGVQAIKGDIPALKEITDRVEGKVAQPIVGADGSPLIPERASLAEEAARLLELVAGRIK
jgi:hypothetical protein